MTERELRGGHFYPLDVRAVLYPARSRRYIAACVRRALLEPASARNASRRRSLAAFERQRRGELTTGTSEASRAAGDRLRSTLGGRARAP